MNRKYILDTHIHTIACGHGYSTINEIAMMAKAENLDLIAITEHSGFVENAFFNNIVEIPQFLYGVEVLKGAELDILDVDGSVSIADKHFDRLDIIIASFHKKMMMPKSKEENTKAFINVMRSKKIHILGHIDNEDFPIDFNEVIEEAKVQNVIIEINNASFMESRGRANTKENMIELIKLCLKYEVYISLGSDAHNAWQVGDFLNIESLVEEINYPAELIVNTDIKLLKKVIKARNELFANNLIHV